MCPFRNPMNIVTIVSFFVAAILLEFGQKKVGDPKLKKALAITEHLIYLAAIIFVSMLFLKSRGYI